MYRSIVASAACILALWMQVYLIFRGDTFVGSAANPFLLSAVSLIIPVYFLVLAYNSGITPANGISTRNKPTMALAGAAIGLFSVALIYSTFRSIIHELPDPATHSDVLPQMNAQYEAFSKGQLPYFPLKLYFWRPYPVYMPLHWLPIGLAVLLQKDPRWVGFVFMFVAAGCYGYFIGQNNNSFLKRIIAIILPALVFYYCIFLDGSDFAATFEIVIAAYYLLLAMGLATGNLFVSTLGIICCLLSRYTMIFWLPLFLVLLWSHASRKNNFLVWGAIVSSIVFIYIIPFYLKDPSILAKGIAYHNHCVVDGWGEENNYSFQAGIYFAPYFRDMLTGSMEHRVFVARVIQALIMLSLFIGGLLLFRRWKHKTAFYDFSLVMLYLFILFFFLFGPLTSRYYYLPLLMIQAVICGKVILQASGAAKEKILAKK